MPKKNKSENQKDHLSLGKDLQLFSFHPEALGAPLYTPKGVIVKNLLTQFIRKLYRERNFLEIETPTILRKNLWVRSGHWDVFRKYMYTTQIGGNEFVIKPTNCHGCMLYYKERKHSYKEFPIRFAELGLVHRYELSGALAGLFRVRSFTMDDTHIFMLPNQIQSEVIGILELIDYIYKTFGFDYEPELCTRPENSIGAPEMWHFMIDEMRKALEFNKMKYRVNEGGGAFYGPKIDFYVKKDLGRGLALSSVQLDMSFPERFDLTYIGKDGKEHRPVLLHSSNIGSLERLFGMLIEHYEGKLPLWLNPTQAKILVISSRHIEYAEKVKEILFKNGVRVGVDYRDETINKKIRDAHKEKVNFILIIGDREVKENLITVRRRDNAASELIAVNCLLSEILEGTKCRI